MIAASIVLMLLGIANMAVASTTGGDDTKELQFRLYYMGMALYVQTGLLVLMFFLTPWRP